MPSRGYRVFWRVAGSGDPYTDAGNFFTSPAVFTDETNPPGTEYEGTIAAQLHSSFCDPINWSTIEDSGGSGSSGGSGGPPPTYYRFEAEVYSCLNCSEPIGTTIVASLSPSVILYKYYIAQFGGDVVYRPIATSTGIQSDNIVGPPYNNCVFACAADPPIE